MLTITYTLSILLMIAVPVVLAALLRRRFSTPWLYFCVGMGTFIGSQIVHIPFNNWLTDLGILPKNGITGEIPIWQTSIVLGLTAGLFEELARVVGYALVRRGRSLADGIMFGLGHGGIESMVIGGVLTASTVSSLLALSGTDLAALKLPADQANTLTVQINTLINNPWQAFLPLLERMLAVGIHVTLSVMVLRAFQKRNALYVVLAILYHALIDAVAVYSAYTAPEQYRSLAVWGFVLVALPGYIWLAWLIIKETRLVERPILTPVKKEWSVFYIALRKEMLQQWRTKRVIVIGAVFLLFGIASPLMAYFMPQMFKAIPGADQFAAMIPTPTAADAMGQYVKNVTQFGFFLALLLGMAAVAGEKERGTASLVLSKPMTRWAFILSKLTAQMSLYLFGFILAFASSYLYTIILFGRLELAPFLLLNVALLFWILPFVTITMLGSVIGGSTGAAAGIALVGVIALLLAGSLPQYGMLMPSGLALWANQLGVQAAGTAPSAISGNTGLTAPTAANAGALVASVVIAVATSMLSIALFEQQEL